MTSTTYNQMISHLPTYERTSAIINEILTAIALELNQIDLSAEENYEELFIDTAIQALKLHERDLNIEKDNLTTAQRRELVTAYFRATIEQVNEDAIKNVVSSFTNGDAEINNTAVDGVYEIRFLDSIGIPDNMQGLASALDIIVPAHIVIEYNYNYTIYSQLTHISYTGLTDLTYAELLVTIPSFDGTSYDELTAFSHVDLSNYTHAQIERGEI